MPFRMKSLLIEAKAALKSTNLIHMEMTNSIQSYKYLQLACRCGPFSHSTRFHWGGSCRAARGAVVKPVRRACARGSKFGQDARSASEMQSCWLDKRGCRFAAAGQTTSGNLQTVLNTFSLICKISNAENGRRRNCTKR